MPLRARPLVMPWVRMKSTRTAVATISVSRFCTGLRISGPVEKIPSTGPPGSELSPVAGPAGSPARPSSTSGSVRWAWNWPM